MAFNMGLMQRSVQPGEVLVGATGCLGPCEQGPTVVVYPDAVWYGRVSEADVDEIIESHIVAGRPVERLRLPDECVNTARCPHKPRPSPVT